ncbi:LAMI_0H11452g1_1 [Lachancea mirantina]|uniref:LAMI_0H11452g1_1 n=1 Tax=Lachancea mirantina TaxID=1230905 RepID=A0A1G4KH08_9SACH|nr:LAMI_0H11452g1_1 [Lachancea mirantina]
MCIDNVPKTRLKSLYSDFKVLKELNPEGFAANKRLWSDFLVDKLSKDRVVLESGSKLLQKLKCDDYGVPLSIDVVLNDLVQHGTLVEMGEFRKGPSTILKVVRWPFKLFNQSDSRLKHNEKNYLKPVDYVIMPHLEKRYEQLSNKLDDICSRATTYKDLIFTQSKFWQKLEIGSRWNEVELSIMLVYLERYKLQIVVGGEIVKICNERVAPLDVSGRPDKVTELDKNIVSVETSKENNLLQMENLERQIDKISQHLARSAKEQRSRDVIKTQLRIKQVLQAKLKESCSRYENLALVSLDLDTAAENVNLQKTYQNVHSALKTVNEYSGEIAHLQDLINDISDERAKTQEVSEILAQNSGSIDEIEIDQELESLIKSMHEQDEALEKLKKLEIKDTEPKVECDPESEPPTNKIQVPLPS